jgi:hypothetical protein
LKSCGDHERDDFVSSLPQTAFFANGKHGQPRPLEIMIKNALIGQSISGLAKSPISRLACFGLNSIIQKPSRSKFFF